MISKTINRVTDSFRRSSRYFLFLASTSFQKFGQLILLALVSVQGSSKDIYIFGLFISWFSLAIPISTLNLHMSIGRMFFYIRDEDGRSSYAKSSLLFSILISIAMVSTLYGFLRLLSYDNSISLLTMPFYGILLCSIAFIVNQFFSVALRIKDFPTPYVVYGVLIGIFTVIIYFVCRNYNIETLYSAIIAYSGSQVFAIIYGIFNTDLLKSKISNRYIFTGMSYSLGTVVYALSQWIANYSGRWISDGVIDLKILAIYTIISQGLVAFGMIIMNFYESSRIYILRDFEENGEIIGIKRINSVFIKTIISSIFFIILYVILYLFSKTYGWFIMEPSWVLSSIIACISYAISMRSYWISIGMMRTKAFAISAVLGSIANLVFALNLIHYIGINALFLGSALGMLVQSFVSIYFVQKRGHLAIGK